MMIDLGILWQKKAVVTESFTLRNAGDAVLEIRGVGCSWECTSSGPKDIRLNPGESWELPLELDLEEQTGLKLHRVVVLSNDPEHPELELKVFGSVQEPITVEPLNGYYFGNIGPNETRQKTLTVKNNLPDPMDLKLVRSEGRNFSAMVESVTPGKEYRLILTARPPYQPNTNRGRLEFATGLSIQPELVLLPQATLPPRLFYPLFLSVPQPLTPGTALIWSVRNNGEKPVKVLGATTSLEGVSAEIKSLQDGRVHNVTLRFSQPVILPPEGSELMVRTDDSEFATIRVRLTPAELPSDPESPASSAGKAADTN